MTPFCLCPETLPHGVETVCVLAAALALGACHPHREAEERKAEIDRLKAEVVKVQEREKERAEEHARKREASRASLAGPPASGEPATSGSAQEGAPVTGAVSGDWILDGLVDIGPSGPATATAVGVVMITRDDALVFAPLGPLPTDAHHPVATPIAAIPDDAGRFPLARGPGVLDGRAYWVSKGKLFRRRIRPLGDLEVLASDARVGTRVASPTDGVPAPAKTPTVVAYVAGPPEKDAMLVGRLWVEGGESVDFTGEGANATSVALVRTTEGLLALSIDARSGMAPVHARTVRFDGKKPVLGDDVVVWIGGSAQPLTEVVPLATTKGDVWGFVALEQDVLHFGLTRVDVGVAPHMESKTKVLPFANGIDPSPVAAATVCGRPLAAFARPTTAEPDSPQELWLSVVTEAGVTRAALVGESRGFFDVSMVPLRGGALVAYSADRRTWARTVRCR